MADRDTLRKHADLFDRMATTLGHDLEESALKGQLRIDEISDAVLACTGCSNPAHCSEWLGTRDTALQAPQYCRNRALLGRLHP